MAEWVYIIHGQMSRVEVSMERDEFTERLKGPSEPGRPETKQRSDELDQEILSEAVLDHIRHLLNEEQASSPSPVEEDTDASQKGRSHCQTLARELKKILADANLRPVLTLHFGTWLKDHPIKHWLWECYQLMDAPENLQDESYIQELAELLERATYLAVEAREDPALMRPLLRRLFTSPTLFMN